jgi:hypothetical protein
MDLLFTHPDPTVNWPVVLVGAAIAYITYTRLCRFASALEKVLNIEVRPNPAPPAPVHQ